MLMHWLLAKKNPLMKIFLVVRETSLNLEYSWVKLKYYIIVPNLIYIIVIVLIVKQYFYLKKNFP